MLELALLGPPHISLDGNPITGFASRKTLLLLCYLALEGEHSHTRIKLAGMLWGESPERRSRANLSDALYNIQQILPGCLSITHNGVALDANYPHQIDVNKLCRIVEQLDADVAQLEEAVSLVRGDFLEGLYADDSPEIEDWLGYERERCRRLQFAALDRLADHYEHHSQWKQSEDIMRRLLRVEPWHEAAQRRLMLALGRQGEYATALAQYETCCQYLEKELGAAPEPETTALYEHIRRASVSRQRRLPLALSVFVGRESELSCLGEWMGNPDCRLITLVGSGGMGKTRLAQELATRYRERFFDGLCYVSLGPINQPEFIITTVAEAAGIRISGSSSPREQLIAALAGQELLVLLDSFEHLMGGADLVADILSGAPQVKIIATSREKLDLQGEWVFVVDGLSIPPEGLQDAAKLESYDAVACLVQRARQHQSDFALKGKEGDIARLCRLLGGSPLGIELAVALLPVLSCAQIVAEVERGLDVLVSTRRDVPERHRSLRAVFDHSWQLLSAEERQIFPWLSVFRGGFTVEAASQITGADLAILSRLVAKSLLRVTVGKEGAPARFDIHEILRQYAQEMLDTQPEAQQRVRVAHSTYYAGVMQQQGEWWRQEEYRKTLAIISQDMDNIRAAWQRAITDRNTQIITQVMHSLYRFYDMRGWYQERSDLFVLALESLQAQAMPDEQLAWGYVVAYHAWNQLYLGNLVEAHQLAQQAVDVLRRFEPGKPLAHALNTLGVMHLNAGDYPIARESIQESLAIYRVSGSRGECISALLNLGYICIGLGDYETARSVLENGLALCYEEGIRESMARFLHNLGYLNLAIGDLTAALYYFEQALPLCDEMELWHFKGIIRIQLGVVGVRQGRFEQALADCQAGMTLLRQVQALQDQAWGWIWQGLAHHGLGDEVAACRGIAEGLDIALKVHTAPPILGLLMGGAILLLGNGRRAAGIDFLMLVARNPATDSGDRAYALELLAGQGITLPKGEAYREERSPIEMARALLVDLRAVSSASVTTKGLVIRPMKIEQIGRLVSAGETSI
ncbi:MAG: tetratricopeptide repeat protein [Anaerolineae bacterium]|nr:tetratricopeptide repeat protein [Anaerolineae bacterium]